MRHDGTVFKGALLIAGTSTGGGMLALPVLTSPGGFFPSIVVYLLCWLFMTATGLLFVELSLSMERGVNLVSMSERTLGFAGKTISWLLYLGLFYCLSVAYIVGCGNLTAQVFNGLIPDWLAPILFVLVFAPFVFVGPRLVGRLNVILMVGLIVSFLAFVVLGASHVDTKLLAYQNWSKALYALPIAFASFAYQGIVPTLVSYMGRDVPKIRKAIIIGTSMTFVTYLIWQWLIQGIVPSEGPGGLLEALKQGDNAVHPLRHFLDNPYVYLVGQYFAFFALVTSFFGVALGLIDFLADGLKIHKIGSGRLLLCLLVFIPPLTIAYLYPHIFLQALDYAGGYGCALLLGLMPILMVWVARYRSALHPTPLIPGGKATLLLLGAFVIFELLFELKLTISKFY
jgi:tyrosine-specific transport protein